MFPTGCTVATLAILSFHLAPSSGQNFCSIALAVDCLIIVTTVLALGEAFPVSKFNLKFLFHFQHQNSEQLRWISWKNILQIFFLSDNWLGSLVFIWELLTLSYSSSDWQKWLGLLWSNFAFIPSFSSSAGWIPLYQSWLHLWSEPSFPSDRCNTLEPVNHFWSLHTATQHYLHLSFREQDSNFPDMYKIASLFLFCVFWGPVHSGPMTSLHPNITDQELFWGADQYDFSVVLRAAGMECFWHFAHQGERFYLSFMVRRNVKVSTCFPQQRKQIFTLENLILWSARTTCELCDKISLILATNVSTCRFRKRKHFLSQK